MLSDLTRGTHRGRLVLPATIVATRVKSALGGGNHGHGDYSFDNSTDLGLHPWRAPVRT